MTKNLNWMVDPLANIQFADTNLGRYELCLVKVEYHSLTFNGEELSRVVAPAHEFNRAIVAEAHYAAISEGKPFIVGSFSRSEMEWRSRERELLHYNNELLEKQRADTRACKKAVSDFDRIYALFKRISSAVGHAADNAEDEGDRAYFGSTNDLDDLKEVSEELAAFEFYVDVEKREPLMLMEQDAASQGFIPIDTAPRNGTRLTLAWLEEDGTVGESFGPMQWSYFIGNPIAQEGKGIWACYDSEGTLLYTWSEANKDGAPTHYKIYENEKAT